MTRRLSKKEWKRAVDASRADTTDDFVKKLSGRYMTTITPTIVCMYSCKCCGLTKVSVTVPAREAQQDVVEFVKATVELLGADHGRINPDCPARELDVYLPMQGDVVGGATLQ